MFILGAGATAGAKGLPVDKGFLRHSRNIIESYDFLPVALNVLHGSDWGERRLEDVWSEIDALYNSPPSISRDLSDRILGLFQARAEDEAGLPAGAPRYYQVYWQEVHKRPPQQYLFLFAGWELRQAICQIYGQVILSGEEKHRALLAGYDDRGRTPVIDFNYDIYLEEALGKDRWFYYPDAPMGDGIEILKPHGSLNWVHRRVWEPGEEIVVNGNGVYSTASWGYGPEGFSQASLIPMARAKREFTPGEESEAIRSRYGKILRRCADVLRQAEHICVVGYSFPAGDLHFQELLDDVRTSRGDALKSLKYIGLDGTVPQWTGKLRDVFGIAFDPEVRVDGF